MSFGGKANLPTKSPKTAGLDASDTSTNEQAVPVPWWIGPDARPLTWIVPEVYNQRTVEVRQKVSKGKEQVVGHQYYGDVAGIAGLGLLRCLRWIESNGDLVWTGCIVRPDNPTHPDYWRVLVTTSVGKFYIYWGRPNQPIDDILLGPLGNANATLRHPAYRHQILVVIIDYYLGDGSGAVPNTRIGGDREPRPAVGNFPAIGNATQGESIVAGMLELATSPIFGAGIPEARFNAAEWEALSAAVIARAGCYAPSLDRARPLRDIVKDFQGYYDGFCRIENGLLRPGFFPHDGTVPAGLTELSVHDFVEQPRVKAGTPSKTINDVLIVYRDGGDLLKKKPVSDSASDNVEARHAHETASVEMLAIIDPQQAHAFAAEAAATGAESEWDGSIKVRRPRAVWASGQPLQAGDNFNLDLIAPEVDQVSRIMKRTDPYTGSPTLEIVAERGVYPTPYLRPADLRPAIGKVVPLAIAHARIFELTPALAGTPIGLPVSVLALRPRAEFDEIPLTTANVLGFNLWYSATGASYDSLGHMVGWAMRGTLRTALANSTADATVQLAMDADNLDLGRLASQSAEGQANDNLLVVIGDEVFSSGAISLSALNYDYACKRARQGSLPAAHAQNAEVWVIYRDELAVFTHKRFVEDQDRTFKLQPYTSSAIIELADVEPLTYHFRDRADELPVVVINAMAAGLKVGLAYSVSGSISDVNGDLASFQVNAVRLTGTGGAVDQEVTLQSGEFAPDDKALYTFKAPVVFPMAGIWLIVVRAYDERVGFTEAQTAELTVALGNGGYGPDDGITPNAVTGVSVTSGLEALILQWTNPTNTPLRYIYLYESTTAVKPANPSFIVIAPQGFYFRTGLPEGAVRYYWLEVEGMNGRKSAVSGPHSATVLTWPVVDDINSRLSVKVLRQATAPDDPNVGDLWFDTTNQNQPKVWNGSAWIAARDALITTLNSQVNDSTTGLAATRAEVFSGAATWADADSALATQISSVSAATTTAQNTANAAVTSAATAQAGVNSVAAEYVLQVVTDTGGNRRIAGFRVTNQGGAGGGTDIVLQADKVAIVNSAGANMKAPFAVVLDSDGVSRVYLDTTIIRSAAITNAMILSLLADKIDAGTLTAMTLVAGKIATDFAMFNRATLGSTFPSSAVQQGTADNGGMGYSNLTVTGTAVYWLTFYGWNTGTGFAENRYGKANARFLCMLNGAAHAAAGSYIEFEIVFRVNGGSLVQVNPFVHSVMPGNPSLSLASGCAIDGLGGDDYVEFGVRAKSPDNASLVDVMAMTVVALNF
jgi:hypothetical protein